MSACRNYQLVTGDEIIFGIPLIGSYNDTIEDANEIARLLKEFQCEVQIIPFNNISSSEYGHPALDVVSASIEVFKENGIKAVSKPSYGGDINAGCGQLKNIN